MRGRALISLSNGESPKCYFRRSPCLSPCPSPYPSPSPTPGILIELATEEDGTGKVVLSGSHQAEVMQTAAAIEELIQEDLPL